MIQIKRLKKIATVVMGGLFLLSSSSMLYSDPKPLSTLTQPIIPVGWTEYYAKSSNCSLYMPTEPEHISEKMTMPEAGFELKYDAYISSSESDSVFMLLVAQYPDFVDEGYAQGSLESFLNGILTYNPTNQLLFADLVLVDGHEALDFFISAGNVYFKGRAVMVKNSLYLMAMECEIPSYDETHYKQFIDSFKLSPGKTAARS
ncbi:hypothetical protein [Rhabdochlamydiaceae symbiont of Dictyostelium giganteum]|uniref:hypothetical protein n=1 Tax=Rhabdochlamydiaceae symbiont of Dictyostelium giganteum TaxID=3342349 RepID=UPI00385014CF